MYSECMSVALVIQNTKRMRRIIVICCIKVARKFLTHTYGESKYLDNITYKVNSHPLKNQEQIKVKECLLQFKSDYFLYHSLSTIIEIKICINTERSESRCALRLRYVDLVVIIGVVVEVCCYNISLYSNLSPKVC
jgi:hypothetical protein